MKQELITISSAVAVGALSRGLTGTMTETSSNTVKSVVNGAVAVGAGFLAVKVKGSDTKSSLLRGSAIGVSIAHGLELVKNVFLSKNNQSFLWPDGFYFFADWQYFCCGVSTFKFGGLFF